MLLGGVCGGLIPYGVLFVRFLEFKLLKNSIQSEMKIQNWINFHRNMELIMQIYAIRNWILF